MCSLDLNISKGVCNGTCLVAKLYKNVIKEIAGKNLDKTCFSIYDIMVNYLREWMNPKSQSKKYGEISEVNMNEMKRNKICG